MATSSIPPYLNGSQGRALRAYLDSLNNFILNVSVSGTSGQISVSNGSFTGGLPAVISIASNPVIPGSASMTIPAGATAAEPSAGNGKLRYDSTTNAFRAVISGAWTDVLTSGYVITSLGTVTTGTWNATVIGMAYGGLGTNLAAANSAVLVSTSAGVPVYTGTMTNGQLAIGSTGATPVAAALTAGTNISITNGAGSITINATGDGLTYSTVSGTSQTAAVNNTYITNNAGLVTVTLPTTFAIGDKVRIRGLGAGGWKLVAGASTTIQYGGVSTSSGGSLASVGQYNTVDIEGLTANSKWTVVASVSAGLVVL